MTASGPASDPMAPRASAPCSCSARRPAVGAAGAEPPRAASQCLEYCAWLLENPGTTAQAMGAALAVAEGTRRSNMSRLRTWLGDRPDGEPYLPDAYTGRITLHPAVSSDWQRLQILTAGGVNRAGDDRSAGRARAGPRRPAGRRRARTVALGRGAAHRHDLLRPRHRRRAGRRARWTPATSTWPAGPRRGRWSPRRVTSCCWPRGSAPSTWPATRAETERLTLQLAAQARHLGVDLDPETVTVLQQVMEGRVRARLA